MKEEGIKLAQQKLKDLNFYHGDIDGIVGEFTKIAVREFQRQNFLKVDGIIGPRTLGELTHNTPKVFSDDGSVNKYPNQRNVSKFFGELITESEFIKKNIVSLKLPYTMRLAWDKEITMNHLMCHRLVYKDLKTILKQTLDHYGIERIQELGLDLFGGGYNRRKIRGGKSMSMHSWGIAFDIDPERNQLRWGKDRARLASLEYDAFWDIVEANGATSLGRKLNYDYMHFQFASV